MKYIRALDYLVLALEKSEDWPLQQRLILNAIGEADAKAALDFCNASSNQVLQLAIMIFSSKDAKARLDAFKLVRERRDVASGIAAINEHNSKAFKAERNYST